MKIINAEMRQHKEIVLNPCDVLIKIIILNIKIVKHLANTYY
jgi:hypothetical protein